MTNIALSRRDAKINMLIGENQQKAQRYEFISEEVKEQAFRFDGLFKPKAKDDRLYFFEAQFKKDFH